MLPVRYQSVVMRCWNDVGIRNNLDIGGTGSMPTICPLYIETRSKCGDTLTNPSGSLGRTLDTMAQVVGSGGGTVVADIEQR